IMGEFTGPIESIINSVFAVDWYTESGETLDLIDPSVHAEQLATAKKDTGTELMQLVPSGPGFTTEPNLRLFVSMAHHAKESLQIVSPYFIPEESLLEAVTTAAYRGVKVSLYVSEESDQMMVGHAQASYYEELMESGVEIYQYPAPAVLHTNCALAVVEVVVMRSSNSFMCSFGLSFDIILMSFDGAVMESLQDVITAYRAASLLLDLTEWKNRSWYKLYLD